MRWRAPLYVAQVDPESLRLIRDSEKIVVPMRGDGINEGENVPRLGNFHTVNVSQSESWITVGESAPTKNYEGDTIIGRISWRQPNLLVD
jgi:hypothetical protein